MCFWVLPKSCRVVVARTTVQAPSADDMANLAVRVQITELDSSIRDKIGDTLEDDELDPDLQGLLPHIPEDLFVDDDLDQESFELEANMPKADDSTPQSNTMST